MKIKKILKGLYYFIVYCFIVLILVLNIKTVQQVNQELAYITQGINIAGYYIDSLRSEVYNRNFQIDEKIKALYEEIQALKEEDKKLYTKFNYLYRLLINEQLKEINKKLLEMKLLYINVVVINDTLGKQGSGVTLKYKDKFYILSAGHLLYKDTDILSLIENGKIIDKLKVIKVDKEIDLLLLVPNNSEIIPEYYTELAEKEPILSEEIYSVGNPIGIEDVLSLGRIINYNKNYVYYYDKTYFGSSGSGIFNMEGKLVGINSAISIANPLGITITNVPSFVISKAARLNVIKSFLKNVN